MCEWQWGVKYFTMNMCFFVSNINFCYYSTLICGCDKCNRQYPLYCTKHEVSCSFILLLIYCRSLEWGWQLAYSSLTSNFTSYLTELILILGLQQTVKDLKLHTVVSNETEWKFMALCTYIITNAMSKYKSQVQVLVNNVRKATKSEIYICTLYCKFQM
jgi:hypothetical protein